MVERVALDQPGPLGELQAPLYQRFLYLVEAPEEAVRYAFVHQGPQPLGRHQLRRARRQELQLDALGHLYSPAGVPPGVVERQEDPLVLPRAYLLGELPESQGERLRADRGQDEPEDLPVPGANEAVKVAPLVASPHPCQRALAGRSPHPPQHGLETQAHLVLGP